MPESMSEPRFHPGLVVEKPMSIRSMMLERAFIFFPGESADQVVQE